MLSYFPFLTEPSHIKCVSGMALTSPTVIVIHETFTSSRILVFGKIIYSNKGNRKKSYLICYILGDIHQLQELVQTFVDLYRL